MSRAETLQQLAKLCRGERDDVVAPTVLGTGVPALDALFPGGGWRTGTIIELMPADVGVGELRLTTPALASITRAERHVAFISPPFIPYAPALSQHGIQLGRLLIIQAQNAKDVLWSCEQTLRCHSFGAVLAWPTAIRDRDIRRLQLAAEAGGSIGFLYRSPEAALQASPAAVRLRLRAEKQGGLTIDVVKCRGARAGISIHVSRSGSEELQKEAVSASSDQSLVTSH